MLFGSLEMWALVQCYTVELGLSSREMSQNVNFGASVWLVIHFCLFLIQSATVGCPKGCVAKTATNYQY